MSRQKTQHNWFSSWQQDYENRKQDIQNIILSRQRAQELQNSIQDAMMYGTGYLQVTDVNQEQVNITGQRVNPFDVIIDSNPGYYNWSKETLRQIFSKKPKKTRRKAPSWL